IVASGTGFVVKGSNTYAEEGKFPTTVTITHGTGTVTVTGQATVTDAPLSATGVTLSTTQGSPLTQVTVARFTDAKSNAPLSDFTATISWGDGQTSVGTVVAETATTFAVRGTHTYQLPGTNSVIVQINDRGGNSTTAKSTVQVSGAAPTV